MENLYISASAVAGQGLFTSINIRPKEVIFRFDGEHIFHEYTPEFAIQGPNWIGVGDREWIVPQPGSPVLYLNHSCKPNVFINKQKEIMSWALIPAHSELFLDYSSTELDPFWSMKCTCKSLHCRHIIRSFPHLPLVIQLQYRPYISRVYWDRESQKSFK